MGTPSYSSHIVSLISAAVPSSDLTILCKNVAVTNASWTPKYDIRAQVNDPARDPYVQMLYKASISQSTGEDWKDVSLTLSTASPVTAASIPELRPIRIAPPAPPPPRPYAQYKTRSSISPYAAPTSMAFSSAPGAPAGLMNDSYAGPELDEES